MSSVLAGSNAFFVFLLLIFVIIIWVRVNKANDKIDALADSQDKKQLAPISITCSSTTPVQKELRLPKGSSVDVVTVFIKNDVAFTDSSSHNVDFKIGTTSTNSNIYHNTSFFSGSTLTAGDYEVDDASYLFTEDNTINLTMTLGHAVDTPVTFDIYVYVETFGYWY